MPVGSSCSASLRSVSRTSEIDTCAPDPLPAALRAAARRSRSRRACPPRPGPAPPPAPGSSPGQCAAGAAPRPAPPCPPQPSSGLLLLSRRDGLSASLEAELSGQLGPPGILLTLQLAQIDGG